MTQRRHFHTLDALRFFAFFKVFLVHLPGTFPALARYVMEGGSVAVQFFFVLSGFLITYLILAEKKRTGRVHFKYFFLRRALKIWPLYYAIVAFAFFTPHILTLLGLAYSNEGYEPNFLFTVAFLENYVAIAQNDAANVSPLGVVWSICVEEHFYITWGLALSFVNIRRLPVLIWCSVGVSLIARAAFLAADLRPLDLLTNLDLFALGAIPAYLLLERKEWFEAVLSRVSAGGKLAYIGLVVAIAIIAPHNPYPILGIMLPSVLGLLFAGLLAVFLSEKTFFGISDGNVFSRLGKLTYGLYLYHTIVINLLRHVFERAGFSLGSTSASLVLLSVALALSIGISALSYRCFEEPFLRLKKYA